MYAAMSTSRQANAPQFRHRPPVRDTHPDGATSKLATTIAATPGK